MKTITRDVIADLWPIYEAGEASADTKDIVEEFLDADPEFAAALRAKPALNGGVTVPPDIETASLNRTRDLVRGNSWLRGLRLAALVLTAFAVMRFVRSTTWNHATTVFVADAVLATAAWSLYAFLLRRYRQRALRT